MSGQYLDPQQGSYAHPASQMPPRPAASGSRIASGIFAVVAGVCLLLTVMVAITDFDRDEFSRLVGALLLSIPLSTVGIIQLARSRRTGRVVPIVLLILASLGCLLAGPATFTLTFPALFWLLCFLLSLAALSMAAASVRARNPYPQERWRRRP